MASIGKANFELYERDKAFVGKPMRAAEELVGKITTYRVKTTDLSTLVFGIITWPTGDSEVVTVDVIDGEDKYQRLQNSGRMTLLNHGDSWVAELNVMKHNQVKGRSTLASAPYDDISKLAESDLLKTLSSFGKVQIGTREQLHGEVNSHRNAQAFMCARGDLEVVAAAWVITRVLAILKDYGM